MERSICPGWYHRPGVGETRLATEMAVEGLVILGEQAPAAQLYPLVRELIGNGAIALRPIFCFPQMIAGVAAVARPTVYETLEPNQVYTVSGAA